MFTVIFSCILTSIFNVEPLRVSMFVNKETTCLLTYLHSIPQTSDIIFYTMSQKEKLATCIFLMITSTNVDQFLYVFLHC